MFGLFRSRETIYLLHYGCKNACRPDIWMIWSTEDGFIAGPLECSMDEAAGHGRTIAAQRGADFWDNYDNHTFL